MRDVEERTLPAENPMYLPRQIIKVEKSFILDSPHSLLLDLSLGFGS